MTPWQILKCAKTVLRLALHAVSCILRNVDHTTNACSEGMDLFLAEKEMCQDCVFTSCTTLKCGETRAWHAINLPFRSLDHDVDTRLRRASRMQHGMCQVLSVQHLRAFSVQGMYVGQRGRIHLRAVP